MGFRVLLITQYLIQKIFVDAILDVHTEGVKIKKISRSRCCNHTSSTKKGLWSNTCVGMHTENHMFLTRP
jgi:hypothetical protein